MIKLFETKKGELALTVYRKEGLGLRLEAAYDGAQADAGLYIDLSTEEYLEMLKAVIPGKVDDALIDLIKKAL